MTKRTLKASTAALLSTSAFFALATPSYAQSLDVPAGSTHTLAADESADTLTGAGTVDLDNYVLTIGADGSSSTFDGDIFGSNGTAYVGSWVLSDGPAWGGLNVPTLSAVQVAAMLFGGAPGDYHISINGTDPNQISNTAHYDQIYVGPGVFADNYYFDNGNGLYDNPGDASAYVQDNTSGQVNYAFTVGTPGGLTKVGTGTLALNGTGNWGGQTQVLGGELVGTTNSISGGSIVVDNASLIYDQGFSGVVAQDISGNGVVTAYAPGQTLTFGGDLTNGQLNVGFDTTVELQGANSFANTAGVWVANNGVLNVADGASVIASETGVLGSGAFMTLDNQGSITGTAYYGVNPYSGMITNGATSNSDALISGGNTGITGGGSLKVDNYGIIQGGTNDGINAWGGDLALTNAVGGTIIGAGTAGGTNGYGVVAAGTLSGTNDGSILGRFSGLRSNGALDFTNNGLIGSGSLDGLGNFVYSTGNNGVEIWGGGTLVNSATGQILGNAMGVYTAGTAGPVVTNAGLIHGQQNGLYATTATTLDNQAGGQVTGGNAGVLASAATGITNAGTISGGNQGVHLVQGGTVANSGTISGGASDWWQRGVLIQGAAGSVTNAAGATISGGRGVDFEGVGGTVDNAGTITGSIDAVQISGTGTVTNQATGAIDGHDFGVRIFGADSTVTNAGTISASDTQSNYFAVRMDGANATVANNGGSITGANGVLLVGSATLTNSGQIHGTNGNGDGVQASGALTATNAAGAVIDAGRIGVSSFGSGITLTNSGSITGNQYGAVYTAGGTNSITNNASGVLSGNGSANGLNLRGTTSVDNAGLIEGSLTAWANGIYGSGGALTVVNTGTIRSHLDGNGVYMSGGTLNLTNSATGVIDQNTGDSTWGVLFDAGATGSVTNAGLIDGETGIYVDTGSNNVTLANSGTVSGSNNAITMLGSGTITNAAGGSIVGGTGSAILADSADAVTIDLQAGSTVSGNVLSAGSGARGVTVSGVLGGAYDASAGTGVDTFSLAAAGSTGGVMLGDGDDSFTTFGGAITGNVDGGAGTDSLTFDVAGNVTYGGNFTAFETGTKTGAGRVSLTGTNSVNTMFVNGGVLAVNGILGSAVTVNSGGTLGGTGTVNGSLLIASGGHLAPGNSIGTITVNGPVTFAAGSTYDVEINPTSSDKLVATGAVTINGGTVNVIGAAGVYAPLTTYQIIQGASVTGTFTSVVDNLAFLDPTLTYTANSVNLVMRRNDIAFAAVASNANQRSAANGVQSLGNGALYDAVLVQDGNGARAAYDALAGAVHPSIAASLAQRDRLRTAQLDQAAAGGEGMAVWADASAGTGNLDATGNGAFAVKGQHRDLLAGVRYDHGPLSLIAGGGRMQTDIDQRRQQGSGDVGSWLLGGQVGYRAGAMRANVGLTYADHNIDVRREVRFPGFAEAQSSSRGGSSRSVYGEVAYATGTDGLNLEPFAGASWQKVSLDSVNETGGLSALSIGKIRMSSTLTEVGIRFSATQLEGHNGLYPMGTLAWQHRFGDRHADMTAALAGGDTFTIHGAALSRDALRANVGVGYRIGAAQVALTYDGRLAGRDTDHAVRATLSVGF